MVRSRSFTTGKAHHHSLQVASRVQVANLKWQKAWASACERPAKLGQSWSGPQPVGPLGDKNSASAFREPSPVKRARASVFPFGNRPPRRQLSTKIPDTREIPSRTSAAQSRIRRSDRSSIHAASSGSEQVACAAGTASTLPSMASDHGTQARRPDCCTSARTSRRTSAKRKRRGRQLSCPLVGNLEKCKQGPFAEGA